MISSAVIAGGGIGGLAAALALQNEQVQVTVLERRRDPDRAGGGVGLMVWHNGVSALQRLGVAEAALERATEVTDFEFRTSRGAPLMRWDVAGLTRKLGSPTIGINRGDLYTVLADALKPGTVQFDANCVGFAQDARGVTVHLAGGGSEHGDILIGADGTSSAVRTQLLGPRKSRYAGYTSWRGLLEFPDEQVPVGHARKLWGPGRRFLFYRTGNGMLYWLALNRAPEGGTDPPGAHRSAIIPQHRGWQEPVEAILEGTSEETIERFDISDHAPLRRWGEGCVTLLGDAAHAMTPNMGQGACQALEDAIVLAGELRARADPAEALRAYEGQRRKRTAYFQRNSRSTGAMGRWQTPVACRIRDAMIRMAFRGPVSRMHEKEMLTAPTFYREEGSAIRNGATDDLRA